MKRPGGIFLLMSSVLLILAGCGNSGVNRVATDGVASPGGVYRTELSEQEMKQGHAAFKIEDNLEINADITREEHYMNGLSSYYIGQFCESKKGQDQSFKENPTVFGNSFEKLGNKLNELIPGKFTDNQLTADYSYKNEPVFQGYYQAENGEDYTCKVIWDTYINAVGNSDSLFCTQFAVQKKGMDANMLSFIASIQKVMPDYKEEKTKYSDDLENNVKVYKKWLENLMGRSLNEEYELISVTKGTMDELNKMGLSETTYENKEYDLLVFHKEIDDIPYGTVNLKYDMKAGEKADAWAMTTSPDNNCLFSMTESDIYLLFCNGKIVQIEADSMRTYEEPYREKQTVVSPAVILEQVRDFYEKKLVIVKKEITEMKLEYAGYYSDSAEGVIKPIVIPIWKVRVYDYEKKCTVEFYYDAFSGKCFAENQIW